MRRLLIAILVVALGWFAYWFIVARAAQSGYEAWFDARRAEGWQAEYSELHLRGFPNRIDTTIDDIRLADPETGLAWTAPFFQIFALSYRPNHLIAVWPNQQTLSSPFQSIDITSDQMRASAVFAPDTRLAIRRANFAAENLQLTSDAAWRTAAASLQVALRRTDDDLEAQSTRYLIALQGIGVAPPAALRTPALPETLSALDLDVTAGFDRPWDRRALEERRPQPTLLAIRTAKAEWGPMQIQIAGEVVADDVGYMQGELILRAKEWQAMVAMARDSGQIDPFVIDGVEQALRLFSSLSGPGEDIDLTLTFKNGRTYAGLLPIGPAPLMVLR
ncbi:DUF2125 domain-containing protein [Cognatishimia maritima]|uniref:DUF2125 domain-containing protein n=1 Tax=Cognatishimia maritima TaxID=870908 RepID=A0A1M5L2W7_9RHOB|nr:DUF2125 domain-containing protein [Cognatishimia maritima]SHG59270.1 hypothetical protein SAMN04488044_1142 [Cognatishimia maritima]